MYSRWQLAAKFIRYYFTASNGKGHGIHSPFVFDFVTQVLNDEQPYPAYATVESLRQQLLQNISSIPVEDHGAGSAISREEGNMTTAVTDRSIASIARNAAKSPKLAQLLFRIVQRYQPANIIELGTSLGISTAYMTLAQPGAALITIEGASAVAAQARLNLASLGLERVTVLTGEFGNTLPAVLNGLDKVALAFVDGNHRKAPTLQYFEQLLSKSDQDSMLIFDDIHWSGEMEMAWETIKAHERVTLTIDLFFIGIVLFHPRFKVKQQFTIRF